jgi:hypothetical protein
MPNRNENLNEKTWTLRNGNAPGNPNRSPRCGALARHFKAGHALEMCRAPGMKMPNGEYGRCRMHGGAAAIANWKHGRYAAQTEAERLEIAELLRQARQIMAEVGEAERQNRDPAKGAEPVDENGSNP